MKRHITEAEMIRRYGKEATDYLYNAFMQDTSVTTLVEHIIDLYEELGDLDNVMKEIKEEMEIIEDDDGNILG